VTVLLLKRSILTEKLARRGQHISREYSVDLFELLRVGDVMDQKVPTIPASMTIKEHAEQITDDLAAGARHGAFIVDEQQKLAGIITRGDVMRAMQKDPAGATSVLKAGQTDLTVTYPDEPLYDAIAKMLKRNIGRMPVVDREDPTRAIGYLGRADILAARTKHHEAEETRSHGPLMAQLKFRSAD
jgi:CBS domain-containing protein